MVNTARFLYRSIMRAKSKTDRILQTSVARGPILLEILWEKRRIGSTKSEEFTVDKGIASIITFSTNKKDRVKLGGDMGLTQHPKILGGVWKYRAGQGPVFTLKE